MTEYRRYYPTRVLISVDDLLEATGEDVILCVDKGALRAIRQLVSERGLWRTSYYKVLEQERYQLPSDEEFDTIDAVISEFLEVSSEMTCEELLAAIQDIASAIRQTACCDLGTGGIQDIGGNLYYGSGAPLVEPTAFGEGEEFETEEEYLAHKCQTANGIVYGLISTLNSLAVIDILNLTLGGAVVGAAITFGLFNPPAALLVALLVAGVVAGALVGVSNAIANNRQDLVCVLFNSTGAVDAYDTFKMAIEELTVDLGFVEVEVGAISNLIMSCSNIDTYNLLFSAVGLPEVPGEDVDCNYCEGCAQHYLAYGEYVDVVGNIHQYRGEQVNPSYEGVLIYFNYDPGGAAYCGDPVSVRLSSYSSVKEPGGAYVWQILNQSGGIIYQNAFAPATTTWFSNVGRFYVRSIEPTTQPQLELEVIFP